MISWPVALHKQPSAQRLSSQAMLTESIEPGWEASPSHHCFGEVMQGKRLVTVVRTCEQTYETASWLSIFKSAIVGLYKYFGKAVPDTSVQSTQGLTSLLTPKAPDSFKVSRHWVCCITTKKEAFWKFEHREIWWKENRFLHSHTSGIHKLTVVIHIPCGQFNAPPASSVFSKKMVECQSIRVISTDPVTDAEVTSVSVSVGCTFLYIFP